MEIRRYRESDLMKLTVQGDIITHASITARPFFENRGYQVVREQQVERQGVFLTNYVMEKKKRSVCNAENFAAGR